MYHDLDVQEDLTMMLDMSIRLVVAKEKKENDIKNGLLLELLNHLVEILRLSKLLGISNTLSNLAADQSEEEANGKEICFKLTDVNDLPAEAQLILEHQCEEDQDVLRMFLITSFLSVKIVKKVVSLRCDLQTKHEALLKETGSLVADVNKVFYRLMVAPG
jgi:hypothetical protein